RPQWKVVNLDKLTYAGNLENLTDLENDPQHVFVRGDIGNRELVDHVIRTHQIDSIMHLAAESHVDRSILDSAPFVRTNVVGTLVLLDVVKARGIPRFLQISTDEVYGSLGPEGLFTEETPITPNSPYSASKAGGDLLVRAYQHTHGLPALIMRSSNAYGPYQFPEKLIPLMISNAFAGRSLPVYGDGMQVRDWVHVEDFAEAVLAVLERGRVGEVYNVGGGNQLPNLEVVGSIVRLCEASPSLIQYVPDRPGHDRRYAMDHSKITRELGWKPSRDFTTGLAETVAWYRANAEWVARVRSGDYQAYYDTQYASRLAAAKPAR
ncbi:MAG: dTDP-glucose 4,6-dehydratase, partial [Gemmatimonadetes bacterium]|nr:dTDP-glucose 4,6-dehydratase [Gemmatimonadota bacterium]